MKPENKGMFWLTPLAIAITLAGCGSSSDNNRGDGTPNVGTALLVMHNGGGSVGQVDRLDDNLNLVGSFDSDANEGIALDLLGNLYAANDAGGAPGNLQVLAGLADRTGDASDPTLDRDLRATGAMTLKGIAIAHRAGLVMAANVGGSSVEVFGSAAGANADPLASTALPGDTWDLTYDEDEDRLFLAMTNGTVLVVDDYVAGGFDATGARTITPHDGSTVANLHGIAYQADSDTLVVTDVGDAAIADDGKVYVISDASSASGTVTPARRLAGPATGLGNPVDLILDDDTAYIAEKSNDAVLVYANIFSGDSGDVAPDRTVDSVKPESLALIVDYQPRPDLSDIVDADDVDFSAVAVTSNPPLPGDPDVVLLTPELNAQIGGFTVGQSLESISFNQVGDAYLSTDDGSNMNGGLTVVNRLDQRDGESFDLARDRTLTGAGTGLVSPKGFDIADQLGWVLVTDNGDPAVRVFGTQAGGDAAPLFTTTLTVAPWDLDYDAAGDRLYVALTDGTVAVFDDYSSAHGAAGPDRVIVPAISGAAVSAPTNLHGIVHVADGDRLIVSDVGSGAIGTDGKLYVLDDASSADGLTEIAIRIDNGDNNTVGNTLLGNPVDIAFDGEDLYVAEKSQNRVLRFDDILESTGGDVAPSAMRAQNAPESLVLIADYLARSPR
ncbi:NHL repeat-containing protein [Alloalcanivorax mobilis]|uniref:hypothetical protein n=1 Tax=Alloalcanivorax mobilis TaxID=2019569 RepID=UPI000C75A8B0|nr:hypothetical protein [Alloalcanivorax mobilis]